MPSPNGDVIFTATGIYTPNLQPVSGSSRSGFGGEQFMPCVHPGFYVGVMYEEARGGRSLGGRLPRISVYTMLDRQKLLTLPELEELKEPTGRHPVYPGQEGLSLDKRFHFLPAHNRLVTIPSVRDRVFVREFDLIRALEKADVDFLFVASLPVRTATKGEPYEYQLEVESRRGGVKYSLESGPERMSVSETGKVEWTPPEDYRDSEVGVVFAISDSSEQEVFHSYVIRVR
jgi:hypothetical protein